MTASGLILSSKIRSNAVGSFTHSVGQSNLRLADGMGEPALPLGRRDREFHLERCPMAQP